jgi:hypothetical protein
MGHTIKISDLVFFKCTMNYPLKVNKLLVIVTIYYTSTYSTDNYMINKEYIMPLS